MRYDQEDQEDQIQYEGGDAISPNHHPVIYLSANTVSAVVSVDGPEKEYLLSRETVENYHPSSQSSAATSSSSRYSPINSSTSDVYPSNNFCCFFYLVCKNIQDYIIHAGRS